MPASLRITIVSVNVARTERRMIQGRSVATAIGKRAVDGPVGVLPLGLEGDEQADQSVHGGISKALYAYPLAHYAFWQGVRQQARVPMADGALPHGFMGENLTLDGVLEADLWIGDRLRLPGCTLAVSEPRQPCFKFDHAMGFNQASKLMAQSGYCGSYLAVIEPGSLQAGQVAELLPGPREVNLRELFVAKMRRKKF
jgi:MOSC domain-containing protein YiiM